MKQKWFLLLVAGCSIALMGCGSRRSIEAELNAEFAYATELFFVDATETAKPLQTQTAAAWTPTPRPTATTAPTPTVDPSIYDYDDPPRDCQDSNDQPAECAGNDILAVRFQPERPNIPLQPGDPVTSFFPLTWMVIELTISSSVHEPQYLVCVNLDLDADITTGIQDPAVRGTEQVNCHAPGMADIFFSEYNSQGEYLRDGFIPSDGMTWSAEDSYMVGLLFAFDDTPREVAEFVPVVISVCADGPLQCDLIADIGFAPAENFVPVPLN